MGWDRCDITNQQEKKQLRDSVDMEEKIYILLWTTIEN